MRPYAGMLYNIYYGLCRYIFNFSVYYVGIKMMRESGGLTFFGLVITSLHITFFHVLSLLCHVDRKHSNQPSDGIRIYLLLRRYRIFSFLQRTEVFNLIGVHYMV